MLSKRFAKLAAQQQQQSAQQRNKKKSQVTRKSLRTVRRIQRQVVRSPLWLEAVLDPFNAQSPYIPDTQVLGSIRAKSRLTIPFVTADTAGTPGVNHGRLITVMPLPQGTTVGTASYNSGSGKFDNFGSLNQNVPNFQALFPLEASPGVTDDSYRVRCTCMAAKVTYLGSELNRAGSVNAQLCEPDMGYINGFGANSYNFGQTDTTLSGSLTPATILNHASKYKIVRDPDGSVCIVSVPSGVPGYHALSVNGNTPAGVDLISANTIPGIAFTILGDLTTSASAAGSSWELDVVWHWEIIPTSAFLQASAAMPSPCDLGALSTCLNAFQFIEPVSISSDTQRSMPGSYAATTTSSTLQQFMRTGGLGEKMMGLGTAAVLTRALRRG